MEREVRETVPLSTTGSPDRRRHPRFPAHLRVEYRRPSHAKNHAGQVLDISESGLMLHLSEQTEVGQNLRLKMFMVSGISSFVEAGVRVVWRKAIRGSGYRIGGKFIDIPSEEKIKLGILLRHLMKSKSN